MRHFTKFLCSSFALLSLLAGSAGCDATIGSDDEAGDTKADTGNDSGNDSGGEFEPCSNANPCPDGQFCFNGLCALGCTSNGDCASDQYCDTDSLLCQNQEVPTCTADDECGEGQICVNQYCSTPPVDTSCTPGALTMDGCESNAICFEGEPDMPACYSMPACAADGTCPVGIQGAICNDGLLPDKDKICLVGLCNTVSDCPTDWLCVRYAANDPIGQCGNGGFGSPCGQASDCLSGSCFEPIPGFGGFCQ